MLRGDSASILCLYRRLIELRRRHRALHSGAFRLIAIEGDVLLYERSAPGERILVALNLGHAEQAVPCAESLAGAELLASTHLDRSGSLSTLTLRADEGVIVLLESGGRN